MTDLGYKMLCLLTSVIIFFPFDLFILAFFDVLPKCLDIIFSSISKSFATILKRRSCGLNGERQGESSVFKIFIFSPVGTLSGTLISSVVRLISSALNGGVFGPLSSYLISRNEVRICSHFLSSLAVGSNRSTSTDVAQRIPCSSSKMSCDWRRSTVEFRLPLVLLLLALDVHSSSSAGASKSISGEIVLSKPYGI